VATYGKRPTCIYVNICVSAMKEEVRDADGHVAANKIFSQSLDLMTSETEARLYKE
jgi:hypothetical protein